MLLTLTRDRSGRIWRLADACGACAAATSRTAAVPETVLAPERPAASPPPARRQLHNEARRVREMLTYLASALGCVTSPAARLLAVQCALRADAEGHARLAAGLLRGMRLYRRAEVWQELARDGWLELPTARAAVMRVRLLDDAILDQAPSRGARRRAAHWALQPAPLTVPSTAAPAERLTALVLAAHTGLSGISADMTVISRLCGHSCQQTGELLDRLAANGTLAAWQHQRDTDEVHWKPASHHQLPLPPASRPAL
ncbi:hypothetical protein [Streptomyces rishiriensis]|uniref:hypothetical protein n=1 Tax=Streptomyces rishiriensis TaxID=68264 RepID=UPI001FE5407F|nr:hypothetical protein [Streptomyces rishiriensis]